MFQVNIKREVTKQTALLILSFKDSSRSIVLKAKLLHCCSTLCSWHDAADVGACRKWRGGARRRHTNSSCES
jgi:hypothetical protein